MDSIFLQQTSTVSRKPERGLALVTVMLIVSIVASIAAFMSLNQQLWFRQTGNGLDRARAENIYRSAVAFSTIVLERDASGNNRDDKTETWAKTIVGLPVESGTASIVIEDAQGKFNLNNVVKNGQPSAIDIAVLRRLFTYLDINHSLVEPLVDWIDVDIQTRPGGAEDTEYLASETPYRAANRMLVDLEELKLVKGFTPETIAKLRGVVTTIPAYNSINVNTAPPVVLGALFSNMSLSSAESLSKTLATRPVNIASEIKNLAGNQNKLTNAAIDTKTNYFLVRLDVTAGRYRGRTETLLYRPDKGLPSQIIRRSRPPVRVAASDSNG